MNGQEAALKALELARRQKLETEAFFSSSSELEVRVFSGQVEHFERADAAGLGLRVIRDGRAGSAYTEDLSPEAIAETLKSAADIAGYLEPQKGVGLHNWPQAGEIAGLDFPDIAAMPVEHKISMVLEMEAATRASSPEVVNVPWAGYGETSINVFVANTAGLERSKRMGSAQLFVDALAGHGEDKKSHYEFCFARKPKELDPETLGRKAGTTAASLLGAREPASGKPDVLLAPRAFAALLAIFSGAFSGRAAEEKRTPLAGRLGQKIGSDGLDIVDDSRMAGGPASRPFDAEGVPTRRLPIVENGVFRNFMHVSDTARRAGVEPTGHAVRSYKSIPSVAPSNLIVPAGRKDLAELRSAATVEVLAILGTAGANPVSGEFSLPALGFALKNGRRAEPIHNFTLAGNFPELLSHVRAAGSDFEFGSPGMGSAFGSGSVLVAGLSIAGAG